MFETVYKAYDRIRRPLRDHHFFYAPAIRIACARLPHTGDDLTRNTLIHILREKAGKSSEASNDFLWMDDLQLVTARKLQRLSPDIFTIALVRDPGTRLAAAFRRQILERDTISETWHVYGFRKGISFDAFAQRACALSDLRADSHIRSQSSMISLDGRIVPQSILRLESLESDWEIMREMAATRDLADPGPLPDIDTDTIEQDESLFHSLPSSTKTRVRLRYKRDYDAFYSKAEMSALPRGVGHSDHSNQAERRIA
ncbi:sulfotransferase family 2 domain-containing protein [Stappia sp. F7233]|uniref:Sulfotransferase family 2 domain-containing protein n=1 Tax=Stappia albiluteola TaxID=2758565 RepID=A0A839ACS3_9HYPH|nr:sulfotransferase family 2 domain-containing protein [Stappia albiluteola]MBA5776667.1 sulfotransferase family 2 domain-containing protein [Stappia albiluteola]